MKKATRNKTLPPPVIWDYPQLIDLEYCLNQDRDTPEAQLHQRDRRIFLDRQESLTEAAKGDQRSLLRLWLNSRIDDDFPTLEEKSPGTIAAEALHLVRTLATFTGLLIGLICGFSFFAYTGETPINVLQFLLLFIASQHLLIAALLFAWVIRRLTPKHPPPTFYSLAFKSVLVRAVSLLNRRWLQQIAADKRGAAQHAFGILRMHSARYAGLFYWPLFGMAQLFAVGFNIGLLTATLIKLATSDLAFGWQSTIGVSAAVLERGTQLVALPWSWLFSPGSVPTLAEIEGSRIILKDGIHHLANQDLVAWWPFLVLCLLVYGLLPRLALLFLGRVMARRSLARLTFTTPPCQALIRRMVTPLLSTQASPERYRQATTDSGDLLKTENQPGGEFLSVMVLIPDDIFDLYPHNKLAELLAPQLLAPGERHRFLLGYDEDQKLYRQLAERIWSDQEALGIVMEGWMPPLVDFLTVLRTLRRTIPPQKIIHLGLLGKPVGSTTAPLSTGDWIVWEQKIASLADPYLHLFSLSP